MSDSGRPETLRAKAHHLLTREEGGAGAHAFRFSLVLLIVASVATAVLKSVPKIGREWGFARTACTCGVWSRIAGRFSFCVSWR